MSSPAKLIIVNQDLAVFDPTSFLPAVPIPSVVMGPIVATGLVTVNKHPLCLVGDELSVVVPSGYNLPSHPVPGSSTFHIKLLTPPQQTKKTMHKKPIITKGVTFVAEFRVTSPAQLITPAGPQPAPLPLHPGMGSFPSPKNINVYAG